MGTLGRATHREPWNKGKLVGQKAPFKPKDLQHGLRYHAGIDQERPIAPGAVVRPRFTMTYVAHHVAPGRPLRLLIAGNNCPLVVVGGPSRRPLCVSDRSAMSIGHRRCWLACDRFWSWLPFNCRT
jgi:hypothetical protein